MKHLSIIVASLVLLGGSVLAFGAELQSPFDQANTEFARRDFRRAAADDEAIIARQGYSVPVLFNLANAYEQDGKTGLAILNYERAELLAPHDADIEFNLHVARAKAGLADRPTAWFEQASRFFSFNTLSWIGAAAALLIAVGVASHRSMMHRRVAWRIGMTVGTCVLLATISAVGLRWSELGDAIVTVKNTPVYISPVTIGQPLYTLAEGQTVSVQNTHGEFALVEMTDGHRGWVKSTDVSRLIPPVPGTHGAPA